MAVTKEMGVLVANRLADVAIGSSETSDPGLALVTEPIFRYRLVVVAAAGESAVRGSPRSWRWLVDPSGTDPGSDTGQLLATLGIPENRIGVFPNQTAAWAAAADGAGVAPAVEHLVAHQLRRGELSLVEVPGLPMDACWYVTLLDRQHRSVAASALRRFLSTPEAMQLMRLAGGRCAPVAVPAARVCHDLELNLREQVIYRCRRLIWKTRVQRAGVRLKQELIRLLRG